MKKVKFLLLVLGVILILLSAFLAYSSQFEFVNGEEEEISERFEIGIQHPSWYAFTFFTAILFSVGFFVNRLGNKIAFYILLPVFSILSGGFALIQTITWGATPFVPQYEFGITLQVIGCLLVSAATIISLHGPKQKRQDTTPNLLDQN